MDGLVHSALLCIPLSGLVQKAIIAPIVCVSTVVAVLLQAAASLE